MFQKRGFSLIEIVIYVAILATLSVLAINTILTMTSTFSKARIVRRITADADGALERIVREIRLASALNLGASSLGIDPAHIVLSSARSHSDSAATVKDIGVVSGRLRLQEGSDPAVFLTSPQTRVTRFQAFRMATTRSEALKLELTFEAGAGRNLVQRNFYSTAILRGSY